MLSRVLPAVFLFAPFLTAQPLIAPRTPLDAEKLEKVVGRRNLGEWLTCALVLAGFGYRAATSALWLVTPTLKSPSVARMTRLLPPLMKFLVACS